MENCKNKGNFNRETYYGLCRKHRNLAIKEKKEKEKGFKNVNQLTDYDLSHL